MVAKRYDNRKVIKRLANGACVMKRVCNQCGKPFVGERNTCQPCRTQQRRIQRQQTYRRRRSKITLLHDAGTLSKKNPITEARNAAFERQKKRIRAEMGVMEKEPRMNANKHK
jgi:hypothetical protein